MIHSEDDDELEQETLVKKRLDTNYCICILQVIGFTMHNFDVIVRKRKAKQRREYYQKGYWHNYREIVKSRYQITSKKGEWIHETMLEMLGISEEAFEHEIQEAS